MTEPQYYLITPEELERACSQMSACGYGVSANYIDAMVKSRPAKESSDKVLDDATEWLFEEFRCYSHGQYYFGSNPVVDWWIERVGYLRTQEGKKELRTKEREQG